jgi:hypothetical protein
MAEFDANYHRERATVHARIAELHTHVAYEQSAVSYMTKEGDDDLAHEFAARARRHSIEAAELSKQALNERPGVYGMMTAAAD